MLELRPSAVPSSPPAFDAVYEEHAEFVWRSLRRIGVREADVEDVCQDVFVVIHRKLPQFEFRSQLKTWVFGICLRTASDYRRKAHVRSEEITDRVLTGAQAASQPEAVARKQARSILDKILDGLDEDKRVTFVLFELEQLPMAEVAQLMGCPLQTAYARLYAARKHVEACVAERRKEVDE